MLPDFNRLKIFYFIYRNKSVMVAAKSLNITQSAVSQQLKKLEGELKVQLFTRLHKQLVPTPAADMLFEITHPFMERLENGIQHIRLPHEKPYGMLRIGAPSEFGKRYLIEICAAFRKRYPDVHFDLTLGHPDTLLPLLRGGKLDLAFADIFMQKGEFSRALSIFSIKPIINEALILVCSKTYNTRQLKGDHALSRLKDAEYIAYQPEYPALRNWFRHHFKIASIQLKIVLTIENVASVIEGIRHHMGLAVIPSHLVHNEMDSGNFVHIRKAKTEIINRISIVQLQDKIPGFAEKAFIQHFNESIQYPKYRLKLKNGSQ
jgi:DNA-binding transcriptional LysR family regulator